MMLSICIFAAIIAAVKNPTAQFLSDPDSDLSSWDPTSDTTLSHAPNLRLFLGFSHRSPRLDFGKSKLAPLLYLCTLTVSQAGDTHPNPGPKYPCGGCGKGVRNAHKAMLCDDCGVWYHKECVGMSSTIYEDFRQLFLDLLFLWRAKFS